MSGKKIIAVSGATGSQGGGLVRAIMNDSSGAFAARALTRDVNSDSAKKLAALGAEVVAADVDDESSLRRAFDGAYGAYCVTFLLEPFLTRAGTCSTWCPGQCASDMRFHMILTNKQQMEYFRMAGIKTLVYTNDSDQRFTYDLVADHVVTAENAIKPSAPSPRETYCKQYPRGRFTEDDGSFEYCDVRDDPENQVSTTAPAATPSTAEAEPLVNSGSSGTATKTVASTIPQSATAVAPAASPAIASGTADTPKPCFTDKSGHTVCLAQH